MSRVPRPPNFAERLARARAGVKAAEDLWRRIDRGVATLPEYQFAMRADVDDRLLKIVSTRTVVRAARRARVAAARDTGLPDWRLAGRVLSYRPDEALPERLVDKIGALRERATQPGTDPAARAQAAITYLVLESDTGAARRAKIWTAGLPEQEAATTTSSITPHHIWHLLHTWQPLWDELDRNHLERTGQPRQDGFVGVVPLEAVAHTLDMGLWAGHERPEPATPGHATP